MQIDEIKLLIRESFRDVEPPSRWCLTDSTEGFEPAMLEQEFEDVPPWESLTAEFLDQTPGGFGSALSFFSDEAFRYYLPAYMIADLDGTLGRAIPVYHLTGGLNRSAAEKINPRRYGDRTWGDWAHYRFSMFSASQAKAIMEYLVYRASRCEFDARSIDQAIGNYWAERAKRSDD